MSHPLADRMRERLRAGGLEPGSWTNDPGDRYAEHRHGYDKVLVAAAGSIVFSLPELGPDIELRAGDRLDLPAGALHGAVVGPTGVTCLEAHLAAGTLDADPHVIAGWDDLAEQRETARSGQA